MSVLIRSNRGADASLGTLKMLGTTPAIEFERYKLRVTAEGGVVLDEPRTLRAFEAMFEARAYGNCNTFISGSFGIKANPQGGIEKAFAIDGVDLEGVAFGTGQLPTLNASGFIDFSSNDPLDAVNGGMLSTPEPSIMSVSGVFGFGARLVSSEVTADFQHLAGITYHADTPNTAIMGAITHNNLNGDMNIQRDPLTPLTTAGGLLTRRAALQLTSRPMIVWRSSVDDGEVIAYRNGVFVGRVEGIPFREITTNSFYLDVGGRFMSSRKYFDSSVLQDFISIREGSPEMAQALSLFI